ncbi:MAG TPA: flagellar hook-associated protein FlgK [Candidatus Paceibacterota bacterium]|nr:flagellar hook-associated protein FlgK [Verrucomicrobiota bacterium]HRY48065.1 flagellar hook-associated protein FlgK [Candidatus Paceibacterota bacterium]
MLDLYGTLSLGQRSLQTQRQGVEIAGHNLANVNNPAYTRQRLIIQTSQAVPSAIGPQGTGADGVAIQQLRNTLVDRQLQGEISTRGYLQAKQQALQYAQADLGQEIDRQSATAESASASEGVGAQYSLAEGLSDLFNNFQSLATNPTSMAERQVLMMKAQTLATQFNQVDQRLGELRGFLNESLQTDIDKVNQLVEEIARLNNQVFNSEVNGFGVANDLRDTRQAKIEELAGLTRIQTVEQANGMIDVAIEGQDLILGNQKIDSLEIHDAGSGQWLARTRSAGQNLTLTGGKMQGTIDARDRDVRKLKEDLNGLAALLIDEVNKIHIAGFSLNGSTGARFFNGTHAGDIEANVDLLNNPALVQASGSATAPGDNSAALAMAKLGNATFEPLNNQSFSQGYGQTVATLGQSLSSVNNQLTDQEVVEKLLKRQRDSYSGVSLDEEMTELMKFQKAFEASARLINTVDEMLDTVISLKR